MGDAHSVAARKQRQREKWDKACLLLFLGLCGAKHARERCGCGVGRDGQTLCLM